MKIKVSLFCLFLSGNMLAQTDTISFLQVTDMHIMFNQAGYLPDLMKQREQVRHYDQGEPRFRQFLKTIPEQTNSDMVIATGDLCDFFEAQTVDGRLLELQPEQFSRLLSDYNIPVLSILGNHDAFTYNWRDGKLDPNQYFAGRARAAWIRNLSCFKDGTYYSKSYQVGKTPYRLIFLDNIFYSFDPEKNTEIPYVDKYQSEWLKNELRKSENEIVIILMHIPFSDTVIQQEVSNELYSILTAGSSVKLILAGHRHKNSVVRFPSGRNSQVVQVETGAFAQDVNNWRQMKLTEDKIFVSFPGKTENEVNISIK
ncbi:MAG: metallophosphoesterase [Bacteroidales bacterium]|jgi:3',5'-cyclic AMP phosphodiesterase CpdA|nr:metallophosphoesterase [Bacteroidales bacterium]